MLETVWQDLRHGARMLAKNPGFSLVAILSIAIGVGANAAMFSVADGLILRPLPVPDASGLVTVSATTPTGEVRNGGISYPDYADLRDRARSFEGLAASRRRDRQPCPSSATSRRRARSGSRSAPTSSTSFASSRRWAVRSCPTKIAWPAAMRSSCSRTRRGPSSSAPTRPSSAERFVSPAQPFTVIGVAPEGFTGTRASSCRPPSTCRWRCCRRSTSARRPTCSSGATFGRSASSAGWSPAPRSRRPARKSTLIARALQQRTPGHERTPRPAGPIERWTRGSPSSRRSPALSAILIGLALAVLLVACANVAGLLTSRAPVRAREIALRLAIGGSRGRLMRQLITESALIAIAGGVVGLALGYGGIRVVPAVSDRQRRRRQVDLRAGSPRARGRLSASPPSARCSRA